MKVTSIYSAERRQVQAHGGHGFVQVCRPLSRSDFAGDWQFVDYAVLPPSASIGLHRHGQNEELYFVIEGQGIMTVNGEERRVVKGDLILNPPEGVHALLNDSVTTLSILVVEVGPEA